MLTNPQITEIKDKIKKYNSEYLSGKDEVKIKRSIHDECLKLPGIIEHRFSQLQEIEYCLKQVEKHYERIKINHFKKYTTNYNKELSSRDAEKYAEGELDTYEAFELLNEVALIRNKFLSLLKGLDSKSYQLNNIVKIKQMGIVGLDDGRELDE